MDNLDSFGAEIMNVLSDYWKSFIHILPRLGLAIIVFLIALFLATKTSKLLNNKLAAKAHDPLFVAFIVKLAKFVVILCGLMLMLQTLGLSGVAGGLLAGAGISAFIFGFAFKDIAENFLGGIILAFNRPFALGDTVKIDEQMGHVIALNFRTTHIKTFDEKDVFIPNAKVIKETLINFTRDGLLRIDFLVGIAYEDDVDKASEIIIREIKKVEGVLPDKIPFVVIEELDTSTVNLRVFFWTATDDYRRGVLITKSEAMQKAKEALSKNGISLPADIQELKIYDKVNALPIEILSSSTRRDKS